MAVQVIANDDSEVSAIVAALEASGFQATITISGRVDVTCPHTAVVGVNCRDCRIAQAQLAYDVALENLKTAEQNIALAVASHG